MPRRSNKNKEKYKIWSAEEIEIIEKHYATSTIKEMEAMLPKRSRFAIINRAYASKISKPRSEGIGEKQLTKIINEKPGRRQTWMDFLVSVKKLDKLTTNKEKAITAAMEHTRGHRYGNR